MEPGEFEGVAGRTLEESTPWWPPLPSAPEGAPNVVVVLLDDVGYAQSGCYGSTIATPTQRNDCRSFVARSSSAGSWVDSRNVLGPPETGNSRRRL